MEKTKRLQIYDPSAKDFDETVKELCQVVGHLCKKGMLKAIVLCYDDEYERPITDAFKIINLQHLN